MWEPRDTHEEDEGAAAFVAGQCDLLSLAADAGADDERLSGAALSYGYAGECGACEDRADAGDDDGLEAVRSEVQNLFAGAAVYGWITLF